MQKTFIGVLLLILAVVLFSLENSKTIVIDFWMWEFESNLSLVLILSVLFGALASSLFSLPYRLKQNKALKSCERKIKNLNETVERLENGLLKPVQNMPREAQEK